MAQTAETLRVLFVTCWYPSVESPAQGLFIREHIKALAQQPDVELVLLVVRVRRGGALWRFGSSTTADDDGVKGYVLEVESIAPKTLYAFSPLLAYMVSNWARKHLFSAWKPDVVHSEVIHPAGVIGSGLATKAGVPHLITEQWSKAAAYLGRPLFGWPGRVAYSKASAVAAVSQFLKGRLSNHVDPVKIHVVPNIADTALFVPKPKPPANQVIRLLCAASWAYPKRPDLIFQALEQVSSLSGGPGIELHVVGSGRQMDELLCRQWSFSVVHHGTLPKYRLAELMHQSHGFLHASDTETFSAVVAEALSTATPVLASHVGALPELVTKEVGVLCGNTVDEWARALQALVQHHWNFDAFANLNNKWSGPAVARKFIHIYREMLRAH